MLKFLFFCLLVHVEVKHPLSHLQINVCTDTKGILFKRYLIFYKPLVGMSVTVWAVSRLSSAVIFEVKTDWKHFEWL